MKILDIPQSGKRGLYVSQGGRYGQISRMLVIPGNPRTASQLDVRRAFGSAAARWRTLTEEQRTAWRAAAKMKNSVPRLGQSGPLTGSQLFTKLNCTLAALGASQVDAPPSFPQFLQNPVGALVITNTGGVITLKLGCPSQPGENTTVRASAPCSQGLAYCEDYRILGGLPVLAQGRAEEIESLPDTEDHGAIRLRPTQPRSAGLGNPASSVPADLVDAAVVKTGVGRDRSRVTGLRRELLRRPPRCP